MPMVDREARTWTLPGMPACMDVRIKRTASYGALLLVAGVLGSGCTAQDATPVAYPGLQGSDCVAVDDQEIPTSRDSGASRPPSSGGYLLNVMLLQDGTCAPVVGAQVEAWAAGHDGTYDTGTHATFPGGAAGIARLDIDPPGVEDDAASAHVHLLVTAPGHCTQIAEHFPQPGQQPAFEVIVMRDDDGTCPTFGQDDVQDETQDSPSSSPSPQDSGEPDL